MYSVRTGRVRTSTRARTDWRYITTSTSSRKALPFHLNLRAQDVEAKGPGKVLRMLIFGKPGAGKGTLAARLVKKYDILSLSTGDLLRRHIEKRTEVGRQAEEIVAGGGLLPDDVMLKVVTSKLDLIHNKHWILDGFPRTLGQGRQLDAHLKKQDSPISLVINLDVPDEVILSRISDRWVHRPSGRIYNTSYKRPKVHGYDDETGEPLIRRPDDDPEIFARRLNQFYASTSPLLSYFAALNTASGTKVVTLKGTSSDEIWPKLERELQQSFPSLRERAQRLDTGGHSLSDAMLEDELGR